MWIKIRCETHRWLVASTLLLGWGCATVPPEFLVAMECELARLREAIGEAARDNERLAEMYGLGAMVVARSKYHSTLNIQQ